MKKTCENCDNARCHTCYSMSGWSWAMIDLMAVVFMATVIGLIWWMF